MNQCLQVHKEQRPCFFAGKKKKEEYRSRLNEITDQLVKLNDEDIECREQEKKILNCKVKFHPSMEFNPAKRCTSKGGI